MFRFLFWRTFFTYVEYGSEELEESGWQGKHTGRNIGKRRSKKFSGLKGSKQGGLGF